MFTKQKNKKSLRSNYPIVSHTPVHKTCAFLVCIVSVIIYNLICKSYYIWLTHLQSDIDIEVNLFIVIFNLKTSITGGVKNNMFAQFKTPDSNSSA